MRGVGILILFGIWCLGFGILPNVCYADLDSYLDYFGKERGHFGVKFEDVFGKDELFFIGADINDLGESAKVCAEKHRFLNEFTTIGLEAQAAFLDDDRYRQQTTAVGSYVYLQMDEYTRFSTEFKYSQPEIYHLRDTADAAIRRYDGQNQVGILLLRAENYPVDSDDYPTRGRKTDLCFEVSSKALGSDFDFLRLTLQNGFYYTPDKWIFAEGPLSKLTFVLSQQAGFMSKFAGEDEIPFFERLYAGGTSTVRGYRPRYLAPRDTEDLPIGGNSMAVLTAEMRYPIYKDIKGAIFYDQGNAWKSSDDFNLTDMKAGAGAGIRWITRFGALRLDYGWGLNANTRQRGGRVHLSLGMKF
jgi:outer membrane protein insertion porin family